MTGRSNQLTNHMIVIIVNLVSGEVYPLGRSSHRSTPNHQNGHVKTPAP